MALRYVAQRCGSTQTTEQLLASLVTPLPASLEALTALIAGELQVVAAEIRADDNLLDWSLDSIRIMGLLESWRRAGRELTFMALAETPTLAAWWALLTEEEVVAA
jgi:bifunctional isochorismate lyase/aryl carrier protein